MVKENHLPLPLCSIFSYHAILIFYLSSTDELNCTFSTDISVQNLSRDWHFLLGPKDSIIAVCVHGGELRLSRLWASVKVMLKFEKTEVQFYEAERWIQILWTSFGWMLHVYILGLFYCVLVWLYMIKVLEVQKKMNLKQNQNWTTTCKKIMKGVSI